MGELYRLTFATGRCYIGITVGKASLRFSAHKAAAKAWMVERKASDPDWWAAMVDKRGKAIKAALAAKKGIQ